MKKNFKKTFVDCFGNPITENKNGKETAVEIDRRLASSLFCLSTLGNTPLTAEEKYMAYDISNRLAKNPEAVELEVEEAAFLKRVAGELLSSGAYGQVVDIIES